MEEINFTYKELIDNIKNKVYTNIVFVVGAGISTSSGIPDFRSPQGVYAALQKYNLEYPEQIFEIKYFTRNPAAFYDVHSKFIAVQPHFTSAHYFIAEMARQEQLLFTFSQNIDGLEQQAGLPDNKICQVHGNLRAARCQKCGFKHEIEKLNQFIRDGVIYKCENCKRGYVRPNVVFFGEQLDKGYQKNLYKIQSADCVFIMGSSMKVAPFNMITDKISKKTPVVLVNRDMIYLNSDKYIHMQNDIDDNIEQIMKDLGWQFPLIKRTYPPGWKKTQEDDNDDDSQEKQKENSNNDDKLNNQKQDLIQKEVEHLDNKKQQNEKQESDQENQLSNEQRKVQDGEHQESNQDNQQEEERKESEEEKYLQESNDEDQIKILKDDKEKNIEEKLNYKDQFNDLNHSIQKNLNEEEQKQE